MTPKERLLIAFKGGGLSDVIQWARPNMNYSDGPNPLCFLYQEPRRDLGDGGAGADAAREFGGYR
jgi:hypothetical protein